MTTKEEEQLKYLQRRREDEMKYWCGKFLGMMEEIESQMREVESGRWLKLQQKNAKKTDTNA